MSSPAARILETALALQRDPGERFRLRDGALPAGLTHVLEVASGAPTAVREAAETLGESEQTVLAAARFYLEQMLFAAPDADAYRVLGVAPDAPVEEIRAHHRWLQRWLHPDRAHAGDASVFATRVNQAWAQLRTPEMRHEYDLRIAEARVGSGVAPIPAARIRRWEFEDAAPVHGQRSRWLLFAALASCAVLAVLILRHEESVEPWEPPAAVAMVEGDGAVDTAPATEHGPLEAALALARPAPVREPTVASMPAPEPAPEPELVPAAAQPPAPAPPPEKVLPPPATATVARARRAPTAAPAPVAVAAATPPAPVSRPAPAPAPRPAAPVAPPTAVATVAAPAAPPPEAAVLLERMRKAEQRVAQLTAYLASEPRAAPLWNDVATKVAADRVRERIAAGGSALDLSSPDWSMRTDDATLRVEYRCDTCRVPKGRLDVKLVWRQGLWLVRGVDMAPSA